MTLLKTFKYISALRIGILLLAFAFISESRAQINPDCNQSLEKIYRLQLETEFLADPRFNWLALPNLQRLPPPILKAPQIVLLTMPYMKNLPKGLSSSEHQFFQAVFHLLRDHKKVFHLMKETEMNVEQMFDKKFAHQSLNIKQKSLAKRHIYLGLLSGIEKLFGFGYTEVTENLSFPEFQKILFAGQTFNDISGADLSLSLGNDYPSLPGHWKHLKLSHRLQLHIILREALDHPEIYGSPQTILAAYKRMGDPTLVLDWSQTGLDTENTTQNSYSLWFQLFDSYENNASSPGFFGEYRKYWPNLPLE